MPGQLGEARAQVGAALGVLPDARAVAVVALVEERAERAHARRHRAGVAVQCRSLAEDGDQPLGILRSRCAAGSRCPSRVRSSSGPENAFCTVTCWSRQKPIRSAFGSSASRRSASSSPVNGSRSGRVRASRAMDSAYRAVVDFDRFSITGSAEAFHGERGERPAADARADRRAHARGRAAATRGPRDPCRRSRRRLDVSGGGRPDAQRGRGAARARRVEPSSCASRSGSSRSSGCRSRIPRAGCSTSRASATGEIVELCWLHGEPAVAHWHRIGEGFAGRRPLDEEEQ